MFVACGGMLWGFHLQHKVRPDGTVVEASTTKSNSLLIVKPDPFEMAFVPRSEQRKEEIQRLWKEADDADRLERETFLKAAEAQRAVKAEM